LGIDSVLIPVWGGAAVQGRGAKGEEEGRQEARLRERIAKRRKRKRKEVGRGGYG